jgi:hypothetical protein
MLRSCPIAFPVETVCHLQERKQEILNETRFNDSPMSKKLIKFIQANKEEFNIHVPSGKVWTKISAQIQKESSSPKKCRDVSGK